MKTKQITYIALFSILLFICSKITIPTIVPFTLQNFGICLCVLCLGSRYGLYTILLTNFVFLLPRLFLVTGGYIWGFLAFPICYYFVEKTENTKTKFLSFCIANILCYILGTAWFLWYYNTNIGTISFQSALTSCVTPFIIPDLLKLVLAFIVYKRIKPYLKQSI